MKKKLCIIVGLIALIMLSLFTAACTGVSLDMTYSDAVEEFYGDGMSLTSIYSAPADAVEFKDKKRVSKRFIIDNRISGSHITGLYLPAGESVTVTIYDDREITARHTISVIASDGSLLKEVSLSATETVISAEEQGGILLFNIAPLSVDTQLNSLLITIDGAMQTPYYRYGLDSEYDFSGSEQYGDVLATIDGGNIRFYIPCSYLSKYTDIKGAMQWWRSVCAYIKRSISQNRMDERNAPVCVYYTEFSSPDCDVLMPVEDLEKLFDSYALGNTADGMDLMLKISACETAKSGIKTVYASELADLAAYNSYMFHKDYFNIFESAQDKEEVFFSNGYNVLKSINKGISSDEAMKYIFLCFMHSFGNDKTTKFIDTFTERSNYNDIDRIAASAADIFGVDVTKFVSEVRGVNFGDGVKNYVKDYEEYVPVFNYYTRVEEQDNAGLGKGVYFGYEEKIDFRATTQVYNGRAVAASVSDDSGNWSAEGGKHIYQSSSDYVRDNYSLTIEAVSGGKKIAVTSYGVMSVNVNAARYELYTNVPYRTMDDAVKGYRDITPSYVTALDRAIGGTDAYPEENDYTKYSLSVTSFNYEPESDGTYRIYLTNSGTGFCLYRLVFGVGDYSATMFDGGIPVHTDSFALYKSEDLKKGYIYNFTLYLLQPQGSNGASIWISNDGGDTKSVITAEHISYPGTKKADMKPYESQIFDFRGLAYPDNLLIPTDNSAWQLHLSGSNYSHTSGNLELLNNGKTVGGAHVCKFTLNNEGQIDIDVKLNGATKLNYFRIYGAIDDNVGIRLRLTKQYGEVEYVIPQEVASAYQVDDSYMGRAYMAKCDGVYTDVRIELKGEGEVWLSEVMAGIMIEDCIYVPHSSSEIWYEGHWMRRSGGIGINGGVNQNASDKSHMEYSFYGDSFALLAARGPEYGSAKIYLDNKLYGEISFYADEWKYQEVMLYNLFDKVGTHTVRIEPKDGSTINVDALVYTTKEYITGEQGIPFNPYYLIAIPAIILLGITICALLDYINKTKPERIARAAAKAQKKEEKARSKADNTKPD